MNKPTDAFNEKKNQISNGVNDFFCQQVPQYITTLPSMKSDLKRWICNIFYFGVGLMYNWGVSAVLRQMPDMHQFPSNVAGMIVLFFILMCSRAVMPRLTDKLVHFVDPYSSFALKSMNVMFVPAVVEIVNNPATTGPEVGRMIGVFIVGYVVGFMLCTILVRSLHLIIFNLFISKKHPKPLSERHGNLTKIHQICTMDEEEVVVDQPTPVYLDPTSASLSASKHNRRASDDSTSSTLTGISISPVPVITQDQVNVSGCSENTVYRDCYTKEKYGPLHSFAIWCMQQSCFDDLTFFIIFCLCAFIYFPLPENSPAMPFFRLFLYFSMTILLYSASCRLPAKMKIIIHPIILSSACVMAGIGYFEQVKGFDIKQGVSLYRTGITFISLVERTNVGWPGGGDILGAAMDVSIISMAFNIYKSRPDSLHDWIIVFATVVPMAFLVMFVTPSFAHAIGCTPADSIVWTSRSVTTAIGIVIGNVLGANLSVVTCLIVFTGIAGPLLSGPLFKLARVRDDDYMTIGITTGSMSHGVGTAYLISKNSRASGMSSLAFAIFGTIGVIVVSIPVLSDTIKRLSGF